MVPGVQLNPSAEGSDSISVNGQSSNQVTFVLDGGNNTDDNSASPSGAQARTPLETVEEFQVQTNQFDVEFGRTTGGVVNAITKRGTNAFRGSAFGYLTNSAMTAPTYFARLAGEGESETDKHQYGGTFGGPILRDKLHFFGSFERYVVGTGLTNVFPTRPELNWSAKEGLNGRNYMIRVDHQINANNTYTARYLTERQPNRDLLTGDRATLSTANYELDIDQTASVAYNRVIGTRALNTVRASIETEDIQRGAEPGDFLETNRKDLEPAGSSLPELRRAGAHQRTTPQCAGAGPRQHVQPVRAGKRGDHDLKFGFQYLYARNRLSEQGSMNGVFSFPGDRPFNAADPSTYPERLSIRVPVPAGVTSFTHSFAYYAQDKWRMTPKLTLNLGLRYDVDIFPFRQDLNPLLNERLPRRQEQLSASRRLRVQRGRASGDSRRHRTLLREIFHRPGVAAAGNRRVRQIAHHQLPRERGRSRPKRGTVADRSDARQWPGREPCVARSALSADSARPEYRHGAVRFTRSADAQCDADVARLRTSGRIDDVRRCRLHSQRRAQLDRVRPEPRR